MSNENRSSKEIDGVGRTTKAAEAEKKMSSSEATTPMDSGGGGAGLEPPPPPPPPPTESEDESSNLSATLRPPKHHQKQPQAGAQNRNSSIKQLTQRFRTFSTDLLRSIESAHDMVDLGNSNFATATQLAAAQHFLAPIYLATGNLQTQQSSASGTGNNVDLNELGLSELVEENEQQIGNRTLGREGDETIETGGGKDVMVEDNVENGGVGKDTVSFKQKNQHHHYHHHHQPPIDEINAALTDDPSRRVIYRNTLTIDNERPKSNKKQSTTTSVVSSPPISPQPPPSPEQPSEKKQSNNRPIDLKSPKDQVDFRIKKRYIFKNGLKIAIPDDIRISILEVFIYLWGVITFFADLISDIILSIEYYKRSETWLGSMTLTFIIVPNVTLSLFSLSWYIDKYYTEKRIRQHEETEKKKNCSNGGPPGMNMSNGMHTNEKNKGPSACDSITFWITTILFVFFQLDLVWKYIQGFVYTLKGWAWGSLFKNLKWEKYYIKKQIKCDTDIGMLRLIDVFLDSGPQVLLQLYVITTQKLKDDGSADFVMFTVFTFERDITSLEVKQSISILSSLFSMGYALAGYHRCLRNQQFIFCLETNKPLPRPMSWPSTIMQFLWYLFLIAPRVLSMSMFASTFRSWFFMVIFTHWIIMYFWILSLKTNYCITSQDVYNAREEIFEKFYNFVCSFIFIFVYFNLKAGPTRLRYLVYYIIFYAENILFCTCYFMFSKDSSFSYKLTMLLIVVIGFWLAITCQIVYYLHCHPSHNIKLCVTNKSKFHFIHKERLRPARFSTSHSPPNNISSSSSSSSSTSSLPAVVDNHAPPLTTSPLPKSLSATAALNTTKVDVEENPLEGVDNEIYYQQEPIETKRCTPVKLSLLNKNSSFASFSSYSSYMHCPLNESVSSIFGGGNNSMMSSDDTFHCPPIVKLRDLLNGDDDEDEEYDNFSRLNKNKSTSSVAKTATIRETSL